MLVAATYSSLGSVSRSPSSQVHLRNKTQLTFGTRQHHRSVLAPLRIAISDPGTQTGEASDYYSLLGLAHTATSSDIKRAYRQFMKTYHPDQSNDEENHEFAVFLNHVYETLMDPDARAEYDAISGFQMTGINPFRDTSYPADLVFVDEFACIGCRNCNNVCPKTFGMEDEYGRARVFTQGVDVDDKLQEAMDTCPVSCIHWVCFLKQ
jgi:ferredoxin